MSLILFYRDCFTADTRIVNGHDMEIEFYDERSKTYFSKDKCFAGMACGMVPTEHTWENIRNVVDLFKIESKTDSVKAREKASKELDNFVVSKWSNSSLIFATENFLLHHRYVANYGGSLEDLNPNVPFMGGTGSSAARMLINSNRMLSQEDFFKLVSYSDRNVSSEFTSIELKNVIGTPWYKKAKK